jgi:hypothetical protein
MNPFAMAFAELLLKGTQRRRHMSETPCQPSAWAGALAEQIEQEMNRRLADKEEELERRRQQFVEYIDKSKAALGAFCISGRPLADCIQDMQHVLADQKGENDSLRLAINAEEIRRDRAIKEAVLQERQECADAAEHAFVGRTWFTRWVARSIAAVIRGRGEG